MPQVNIVVIQPAGYLHSLGLLDPARYLRYQLKRLGAAVTLTKNRLREDAINIVFGAHLGFAPELRKRHTCIFFNLEQLGAGGASVRREYLELLSKSAVVDYDIDNVANYRDDARHGVVVDIGHAPYLDQGTGIPLEERPIDLLFFGSMNQRRQTLFDRIEACGVSVSIFDQVLYGPERDHFIRQAKAVLNCHFYEASRFEQVRASHCLSLGTPVVSERRARTRPAPAFEHSVGWFDDNSLEDFFGRHFMSAEFFASCRQQLAHFRAEDPIDTYARLLKFAVEVHQRQLANTDRTTARPTHLMLGAGHRYDPSWLNADASEANQPDLVLDLGQPLQLPLETRTRRGGSVRIEPGQLQMIRAADAPARVPDLAVLMANAMQLLRVGGEFEAEVPCDAQRANGLAVDHIRVLNEQSWSCYVQRFWQLGWFDHRFEVVAVEWLDETSRACAREHAALLRMRLRKVETSPHERTIARSMSIDFGQLADDPVAVGAAAAQLATEPDRRLLAA